jgi:hypothetical protein
VSSFPRLLPTAGGRPAALPSSLSAVRRPSDDERAPPSRPGSASAMPNTMPGETVKVELGGTTSGVFAAAP